MNSSTTNNTDAWTGTFTSIDPGVYDLNGYTGWVAPASLTIPINSIQLFPWSGTNTPSPDWEDMMKDWEKMKFSVEPEDEYQIAKKKWERYFGIA